MSELLVAREDPRQPDITALLAHSDAYAAALYPEEGRHPVDAATLAGASARFLVVRRDGVAVGCGAILLRGDGTAELKRVIVDPAARGMGIGRLLLQALEDAAREAGVATLLLETGPKNLQALGLYRRFCYSERGPFGNYAPSEHSIFMQKPLAP